MNFLSFIKIIGYILTINLELLLILYNEINGFTLFGTIKMGSR